MKHIDLFNIFKINENENQNKIAFDDEIKYELKRYLNDSKYSKSNIIDDRVNQLMKMFRIFINNNVDKMSSDEIAKRLYEYDKNLNN